MKTIYKALQVEVNFTATYNPNANGLCEQVNRNISLLIRMMLDEEVDNWPMKLNILFSAYNASPQTSTGYSPNYLVYGRELIEPLDTLLYRDGVIGAKQMDILGELERRTALRRKALDLLSIQYEEKYNKVMEKMENNDTVEKFEVGEQVGFKLPGKGGKLARSYEINHVVVKVIGPTSYVIRNTDSGFERIVNVRKMRKLGFHRKNENVNNGDTVATHSGFSDDDEEEDADGKMERENEDGDEDDELSKHALNGQRWKGRLRKKELLKQPERLKVE